MGILNVTPDSFVQHCQDFHPETILGDFQKLIAQGARIIDIGACSTRPNSHPISEQEEWHRLHIALSAIRASYPDFPISIDTFRASIAQKAVEQFYIQMINDISGMADPGMLPLLSRAHVPYILTHSRGACTHWNEHTHVASELLHFFAHKLDTLHRAGVADVFIDPGLGFGKTIAQNYAILHTLPLLKQLNAPIVIGLSRKSMLYQPLNISPSQALNATTAANVLALMGGANILRVHDVVEAREAIDIIHLFHTNH